VTRIIEKKIWPEHFENRRTGAKGYELRQEDDGPFQVGDILVLREFDLGRGAYTGQKEIAVVRGVQRDLVGLAAGFALLTLETVEWALKDPRIAAPVYTHLTADGILSTAAEAEQFLDATPLTLAAPMPDLLPGLILIPCNPRCTYVEIIVRVTPCRVAIPGCLTAHCHTRLQDGTIRQTSEWDGTLIPAVTYLDLAPDHDDVFALVLEDDPAFKFFRLSNYNDAAPVGTPLSLFG
jgi:hypothetical protein